MSSQEKKKLDSLKETRCFFFKDSCYAILKKEKADVLFTSRSSECTCLRFTNYENNK